MGKEHGENNTWAEREKIRKNHLIKTGCLIVCQCVDHDSFLLPLCGQINIALKKLIKQLTVKLLMEENEQFQIVDTGVKH